MYGPLLDGAGPSSSSSVPAAPSSITARPHRPLQHEDLHRRGRDARVGRHPAEDGQHVALDVIDLGDRGPALDELAHPLFVLDLEHAQELLARAVEVLLVAGLRQGQPLAEFAVDAGGEEQGAGLVEFHASFSRPGRRVRGLGFEPR
jgi:hypothetical protein